MVPMTVGAVTCGVTLIIENTQSLAADQVSKFKESLFGYYPLQQLLYHDLKEPLSHSFLLSLNLYKCS